jgi:hypothetical protein
MRRPEFYPKASQGLPKCTNLNGPKFPTTRAALDAVAERENKSRGAHYTLGCGDIVLKWRASLYC